MQPPPAALTSRQQENSSQTSASVSPSTELTAAVVQCLSSWGLVGGGGTQARSFT